MSGCKVCGATFEKAEDYYAHIEEHLVTLDQLEKRIRILEQGCVHQKHLEHYAMGVDSRLDSLEGHLISTGKLQTLIDERIAALEKTGGTAGRTDAGNEPINEPDANSEGKKGGKHK